MTQTFFTTFQHMCIKFLATEMFADPVGTWCGLRPSKIKTDWRDNVILSVYINKTVLLLNG